MNANTIERWSSGNYRYLIASLAGVRLVLENFVARQHNQSVSSEGAAIQVVIDAAEALLPAPSALQQLCSEFKLSDFERDVLLLCVGMELEPTFAALCAEANGNVELSYPTFNLAMSALTAPRWDAISPYRPLRYWQLIEVVGGGKTLTCCQLRINERILHYLMGVDCFDEALKGTIEPVSTIEVGMTRSPSLSLSNSHLMLASQIAAILTNNRVREQSSLTVGSLPAVGPQLPILQLCGSEVASKMEIAAAACEIAGMKLATLSTSSIPTITAELNNLILLWQREAKLSRSVLLLDCDEIEFSETAKENAIAQFIAKIASPLIIATPDRRRTSKRPFITFDIAPPTKQEQLEIWQNALGEIATTLNGQVELLVEQFNLNAPAIYAVCDEAFGQNSDGDGANFTDYFSPQPTSKINPQAAIRDRLWNTCRAQARPRLDDLAQRILPGASWDDLVLSETARNTLREIAAHVRQRTKVYGQWGFASKGGRGLGISALFAGMSGTGKTMSAEVLAAELELDLYRIDLSSVVSKYIGETEKNLRRVFDAAEGGATILLFDEADAIFGKRSEVKDSHDRYANMEVSYLLQRMEAYQGLAILTTNLKDSLDTAFMRRIRFVVKYPFPSTQERAEIWRRIFPKNTPAQGLDFAKLARLNIAGGNIRNIALNAAFMAADAGESVMMKHLLVATQAEYVKLERTLTDGEIKGWV